MTRLRIKEVCKEKGISINELADRVTMTRVSISNMIAGRQSPPIDTLDRIADALGVETWELLKSPDSNTESNEIICPKCGSRFKMIE